jgi:hypothetical protein
VPDAHGNFKGIVVPELPLSMRRCPNTDLSRSECICSDCNPPSRDELESRAFREVDWAACADDSLPADCVAITGADGKKRVYQYEPEVRDD